MSEQDKFEAQGRAHAALKTAKSNRATLVASLGEYASALRNMSQSIERLLADPARCDHSDSETLQRQLRELPTQRAVTQLGELFAEAKRVQLLEEQISQF